MKKEKMLRLTLTAIFTAIVLVVQMVGSSIKVGPVSFSLVLIPIVVGGMLISTLLTMFIVPAVYTYISTNRINKKEA